MEKSSRTSRSGGWKKACGGVISKGPFGGSGIESLEPKPDVHLCIASSRVQLRSAWPGAARGRPGAGDQRVWDGDRMRGVWEPRVYPCSLQTRTFHSQRFCCVSFAWTLENRRPTGGEGSGWGHAGGSPVGVSQVMLGLLPRPRLWGVEVPALRVQTSVWKTTRSLPCCHRPGARTCVCRPRTPLLLGPRTRQNPLGPFS